MKYIIIFLISFVYSGFWSQTWVKEKVLTLKDSSHSWTSDEWGQLYQWKANSIWFLQDLNATYFQQTFKSLGQISSLQPINGLRSFIFAENQQLLGILDNTLEVKDGFLAFYDFNLSNITRVAKSARPDFIWLFDAYRERLILFNINTLEITQIVDNCFEGLAENQIINFFEYGQNLICLLSDGRIFKFDQNLTLISKDSIASEKQIFGFQNELWLLDSDTLYPLNSQWKYSPIVLPTPSFDEIQILQEHLYLQHGSKIDVFSLKM